MANGVLLIQLVEILCDDTIERYNKKPSMLVHCIENITIAMAFLKDHGFDPSGVAIAGASPQKKFTFSRAYPQLVSFQQRSRKVIQSRSWACFGV